MTLQDRLRRLFGRATPKRTSSSGKTVVVAGGGRISTDRESPYFSHFNFLPRRGYTNVDVASLFEDKDRIFSYAEIFAILADVDPDLSLALHNNTRLVNSNLTVTVYKAGQNEVVDQAGQQLADDFLKGVNKQAGGISNVNVQFTQSGYLQGAIAGEAVFDKKTLTVVDIAPVNPNSVFFFLEADGTLAPYQYQENPKKGPGITIRDNNYVKLNPETFWYVPVDPAIGDPYGRSPATAAIADIFFTMRVMYDLRQVIHNQGWPRIDVTVMSDILKKMAPDSLMDDPDGLADWINKRITEIQTAYNGLKPDDTFVHSDGVEVGMVGTEGGGRIFDPSPLLLSLERRVIRGLKQLPVLMGSNEGTTETHGTVQFAIYAKSIEAFQKMIEDILEGVLELMLRMQGRQCTVKVEFERLRTTDRLADAQAEAAEIANEVEKVNQGWISNEQASITVTGSEPFLSDDELAEKKEQDAALMGKGPAAEQPEDKNASKDKATNAAPQTRAGKKKG